MTLQKLDQRPENSYNILFESAFHPDQGTRYPNSDRKDMPQPKRDPDGWIGYKGPNILWENWPRDPESKLPMFHFITVRVPEEYRTNGPEYVGLSFFQGYTEDVNYTTEAPSAFTEDWAKYVEHPQFMELTDIIDKKFGYIWLTEEELTPKAPAPDLRNDQEKADTPYGPHAWQDYSPYEPIQTCQWLWLVERNDPNTGLTPNEKGEEGYVNQWQLPKELWDELAGYSHFGGTTFCVQGMPEGLTPFYLEVEEVPGANFGDSGNAQLDLKSGVFDWACG